MKIHRLFTLTLLTLVTGALSPLSASAGGKVPRTGAMSLDAEESTDRLIVKLREPVAADPELKIESLGGRQGLRLRRLRGMTGSAHVVQLANRLSRADATALARRLSSDAAVAYVEPDLKMYPQRAPNDPLYAQQWHYYEPIGGVNLPGAWDITTGAANITVAVIDTGIVAHADLAGRLVAGYDFVSNAATSNDGNGRDGDASDPGDYGCNGSASSWHGTHVAGTIGAATDNGAGVAGINWVSKIQPVRVLGQCGGYTSDIIDGMRWAAGIAVAGVPANPTPARVLNLSVGGPGACSNSFQNAINDVTARGAVVVVAAGNSSADAAGFAPAGCSGVVTVGATTRNGSRASFSNYGSKLTISAPGGSGILSTVNAGSTVPAGDSFANFQGTSMATPHVSGIVSLMLSANPSLTPAQVSAMLKSSARPFPTGTGDDCNTSVCGAGIVDAAAALRAAAPVTPTPVATGNLALASSGTVMTASSTYSSGFAPTGTNDGQRSGVNWSSAGGWIDATNGQYPDWLQADFGIVRSVAEVDVFTVQDNWQAPLEPTESMTFTQYGIVDFEVQYWTGSAWQTVPGGSVTGNNKVWRKFTFTPVSTRYIRVLVTNARDGWSRITELEVYPSRTVNVALPANGGNATASSTYANWAASTVINGDRRGANAGAGGAYWIDSSAATYPDTLQVNFTGTKSISEIDVFSVQDDYLSPQEPTEAMTFGLYGLVDFDVQYWNGTTWTLVPGGSIRANDKVWRKLSFPALQTNAVRVNVLRAADGWSRMTELEVYGTP